MTVFKTFLKILNKNKFIVLIYTIMLLVFGVFGQRSNEVSTSYLNEKPDIMIECDDDNPIAKSLIGYLEENSNIKNPKNAEDALFYREINYIIKIDSNFSKDIKEGKTPNIEVKSTGDYNASLANMLLEKYIKTIKAYSSLGLVESKLIKKTEKTLDSKTDIQMTTKLDTNSLSQITLFYNFANYSLLAGAIYVIALILSTFKNENIRKRTIISKMNYKKYNRILFFANSLFAIFLWGLYVILSIILLGKGMLSMHGLLYIINSLVFTFCALSLAILLSNLIKNKDAINGIVNVVALGSSFLCGSFVPVEWLPESVLKIAHVLPSYWYINTNETIKTLETIDLTTTLPIFKNMLVVVFFIVLFALISNYITKKNRRLD